MGDIFKAGLVFRGNSGVREYYALLIDSSGLTIEISKVRGALGDSCGQYGYTHYVPIQYECLTSAGISAGLIADFNLKLKAEGQQLYGKVWAYGTPEPTVWDIQIEDLDYTVNSGIGGVAVLNGLFNNASSTNYTAQAAFDDVVFATEEPAPPDIKQMDIGAANATNYLLAYDYDNTISSQCIPGKWITPWQLSSATSTAPPYPSTLGQICYQRDATMYGKQELGYAFVLVSVPAEQSTFYESCFTWHEDLSVNENPVHGFYGPGLGPSNKARCNLSGTPDGTSVIIDIDMKNQVPHVVTVNSSSVPQVSYDPSGYGGSGRLIVEATTCQSTSNEPWTIPDSIFALMIYTNPDYGSEYLGIIGHTDQPGIFQSSNRHDY